MAKYQLPNVFVRAWGKSPIVSVQVNGQTQRPLQIQDEPAFLFSCSPLFSSDLSNEIIVQCGFSSQVQKTQSKFFIQGFAVCRLWFQLNFNSISVEFQLNFSWIAIQFQFQNSVIGFYFLISRNWWIFFLGARLNFMCLQFFKLRKIIKSLFFQFEVDEFFLISVCLGHPEKLVESKSVQVLLPWKIFRSAKL